MNFISKHLIEKIYEEIKKKQAILKHEHFYYFDEPITTIDETIAHLFEIIRMIEKIPDTNTTGLHYEKIFKINDKEKDFLTRIISLKILESYNVFRLHTQAEPGDPFFYHKSQIASISIFKQFCFGATDSQFEISSRFSSFNFS
jgi:hypothetical protein